MSGLATLSEVQFIGVRVSVYVQAVLAVLPLMLFSTDDNLNATDATVDTCEASSLAVLVTGCALLTTAFIQGTRGSLDVYNALLVFQLSWLNNMTAALPTFLLLFGAERWKTAVLHCIHTIALGAFGLWLFRDLQSWSPGCADEYYLYLCGRSFQAIGPKLHDFIIFLSILAVIPVANLFTTSGYLLGGLITSYEGVPLGGATMISIFWLAPVIILIDATEEFIKRNRDAVVEASDQGTWTFGQVSAVLLLVPPSWALIALIKSLLTGEGQVGRYRGAGRG